jgi:hypothetical protein
MCPLRLAPLPSPTSPRDCGWRAYRSSLRTRARHSRLDDVGFVHKNGRGCVVALLPGLRQIELDAAGGRGDVRYQPLHQVLLRTAQRHPLVPRQRRLPSRHSLCPGRRHRPRLHQDQSHPRLPHSGELQDEHPGASSWTPSSAFPCPAGCCSPCWRGRRRRRWGCSDASSAAGPGRRRRRSPSWQPWPVRLTLRPWWTISGGSDVGVEGQGGGIEGLACLSTRDSRLDECFRDSGSVRRNKLSEVQTQGGRKKGGLASPTSLLMKVGMRSKLTMRCCGAT